MSSTLSSIKPKHLHTLKRSKTNKTIYRCIDPHCTFYQKAEFIEGKEVICALCGRAYIVDANQLRNATPRCEYCQDTKKSRAYLKSIDKISALVDADLSQEFRDNETIEFPEPIIEPNPFLPLLPQEKEEKNE